MSDDDFVEDGTIAELIGSEVVTHPADITVRDAAKALTEEEVGVIVIGSPDRVVAVVSERDIVRAVATGVDLDTTAATTIGNTDLRWATVDSTVPEVIDEMMTNYVRHVLVGGDGGGLVGILSMRDLLAAFPR